MYISPIGGFGLPMTQRPFGYAQSSIVAFNIDPGDASWVSARVSLVSSAGIPRLPHSGSDRLGLERRDERRRTRGSGFEERCGEHD